MENNTAFYVLDTCDGVALLVSLWITTRYQHHAHGSTLVKGDGTLVEVPLGHTLKQVNQVALQAQHHSLSLWVAHSAVIFNHIWLSLFAGGVGTVNQSEEDKAFIVDTVGSQTLYGWTDNTILYLLHPLLGGERHGAHATHTTCVQTGIMLANTLVILGLGQNLVVLTVCQHEYRALDTAHELLDHHAARCVTEHTTQHLLQLFLGFFECRQNQYALTGTQTVGFQHVGGFECLQELQTLFQVFAIKGLIAGCRNMVALHKGLGKILRAFEHSTGFRRTNHGYVLGALIGLQVVVDTLYQGILRTHHYHLDALLNYKLLDSLKVISLQIYCLAAVACTGITWGDVQLFAFLTLSNFPSQGVLTSATS